MGYPIAVGVTVAPGAYTKTANLIQNRNQFLQKGRIILIAKGSVIGINATLNVGGVALCDDLPLSFLGTTGALDLKANVMIDQVVAGGVAEFFLRNTTATGGTTADYTVYFEPMK
jgi:hypothetical protein